MEINGNMAKFELVYLVSIIYGCLPPCQRWCCRKVYPDPVLGVRVLLQLPRKTLRIESDKLNLSIRLFIGMRLAAENTTWSSRKMHNSKMCPMANIYIYLIF